MPIAEGIADDRQRPQVSRVEGRHAATQGVDRRACAADLNHNPQLRQAFDIAIDHRASAGGARVGVANPMEQIRQVERAVTQRCEQRAEA